MEYASITFKADVIDHFVLMYHTYYVKGTAQKDKPTDNYHLTTYYLYYYFFELPFWWSENCFSIALRSFTQAQTVPNSYLKIGGLGRCN